jgi:hypothetical protein
MYLCVFFCELSDGFIQDSSLFSCHDITEILWKVALNIINLFRVLFRQVSLYVYMISSNKSSTAFTMSKRNTPPLLSLHERVTIWHRGHIIGHGDRLR